MSQLHTPQRVAALELPEHAEALGLSVRAAERRIEESQHSGQCIDLTGADTHRFPPPSWVVSDFVTAATGGGATYTPARGDRSVREIVAGSISSFLGFPVSGDQNLILTPGTQAGLFTALSALLDPGDTVLLPDPDYLLTERICRFFGAQVQRVRLDMDNEGNARLDLDQLEELMSRNPRVLVFSNPNNPSGAVYTQSQLDEVARLAEHHGVFILADEPYSRLVYDGRTATHIAHDERVRKHSLTLLGPSKTESMSGYRVGTAVGPSWLVDRMSDILYVSAIRCPAYAQHTLTRWLAEDHDFVANRISEYQTLRDITVTALDQMPGVHVGRPGGTSYVFPSFSGLDVGGPETLPPPQGRGRAHRQSRIPVRPGIIRARPNLLRPERAELGRRPGPHRVLGTAEALVTEAPATLTPNGLYSMVSSLRQSRLRRRNHAPR